MTSFESKTNEDSSSDESDDGPLWDSTDDSDSDEAPPNKKQRSAHEEGGDGAEDSDVGDTAEGPESITLSVEEDNDTDDEREPYEMRRFGNLRDVIKFMDHYQQETMTHFTSFSRQGAFGDEKKIPNVHRGRLYFESLKGKFGMPITYDGVPFIHIGRWSFGCHQGVDRNLKQKELYLKKRKEKCLKEGIKIEVRQRTTKKVNCPAEIYISHIVKFPEHKVSEGQVASNSLPSDQVRRLIKRRLSEQYKRQPSSIACQHWYYVRIPQPWAHKGHPVMANASTFTSSTVPLGTKVTLNADAVARMYDKRKSAIEGIVIRTKEPVDPSVLEKIRACFKEGIEDEKDIRQVINSFVKDELFAGKNPPPGIFRKYNPTHKDIANEIAKAKKELSAAKVYKLKQVCSSFVADIAQLLPSIDDEQTLEQLQQQLSNVYDITRMAAPQHIDQVQPTQATPEAEQMDGPSATDILLSDQAALVIPQTLTVHHQEPNPQHMNHLHHHTTQPSLVQADAVVNNTVTYQNYTVQSIGPINGLNTIGAQTISSGPSQGTLGPSITIHGGQATQTYDIATLQQHSNGVASQFDASGYRTRKINTISSWYA